MRAKMILDLTGMYTIPATNDHVALTSYYMQISGRVNSSEVSGAQKPVRREGRARRRRLPEIAGHHVRTAYRDIADLTGRLRVLVGVENHDLDPLERPTDRARSGLARPGRRDRHRRRRFRKSICNLKFRGHDGESARARR